MKISRANLYISILYTALMLLGSACSPAPTALTLPDWMESTTRWRGAKPPINTTRVDLAIARYAKSYGAQSGKANFREFAVQPPKTHTDVIAAIDASLTAAGVNGSKQATSNLLDDVSETTWTLRGNQKILMVYLSQIDPARKDAPAFVLLFEPK
jgi:hypothetical protein